MILTALQPLLAITTDSPLAPQGQPSIVSYVLTGLVTLLVLLVLYMLQGERERRVREAQIKQKNDEQMAAVNQSLTLLLSKQGDTTADLTAQAAQVKALETKQSAYDVSLALLKQEIEMHIRTSEEDRRRLHDNITAVRDGLATNRRSVERQD